jgi:hypothetical protein
MVWNKELGQRWPGCRDEGWVGQLARVYSASIQENDENDADDDATRERGVPRPPGWESLTLVVPASKSEIPSLSSASLLAPSTALAAVTRPRIAPGFWATGPTAPRQNICAQRRRYTGSVETSTP